jgi:hypothetical protein
MKAAIAALAAFIADNSRKTVYAILAIIPAAHTDHRVPHHRVGGAARMKRVGAALAASAAACHLRAVCVRVAAWAATRRQLGGEHQRARSGTSR